MSSAEQLSGQNMETQEERLGTGTLRHRHRDEYEGGPSARRINPALQNDPWFCGGGAASAAHKQPQIKGDWLLVAYRADGTSTGLGTYKTKDDATKHMHDDARVNLGSSYDLYERHATFEYQLVAQAAKKTRQFEDPRETTAGPGYYADRNI